MSTAWAAIQERHLELPSLSNPEALVIQRFSACGDELSFERLLHEAAHGLALARNIRDTSRGGRYHNLQYCRMAEELGLHLIEPAHPSSGFSRVVMTQETRHTYEVAIGRFQEALDRHAQYAIEVDTPKIFRGPLTRNTGSGGGVRVKAVCLCGRNLQVVPSVLAQAPITCGSCGEQFQ
ncbi:hypothetical protein [Streptomyces sp. NPDC053431]|uniref:hypothetical protein n=1 Tax=Streptomyces sp. NPDC053431 TaxID=3365703 RepID=UPI0037D26303